VDLSHVTPRERAVLELLGDHLTHDEIGRKLFISTRTVESHVAHLRHKLGVPDHRGLVRLASEYRLDGARESPASTVKIPLTTFVGRRREIAEVADALAGSRLVSVVGPGGVGKTRLALAVALSAASTFADGVRLVDLVGVVDTEGVDVAVARACGAIPTSRREPVEALVSELRRRQVLLLLDNCERHLDGVAELTERLLTTCAGLSVIVTSRVRLALAAERVYRLEGLSAGGNGDAVALFVERAMAAGSTPPTTSDLDRIDGICRSVDGLALAVELAAVQLPSLGLAGMEQAMLDQERLLVGGSRLTPRHRSMHETLDWSVAMLESPAHAVLCRLAVLAGPFGSDAAVAVAGFVPVEAQLMPFVLRTLVEHNLVATTATATGELAYRLLEPVRQYALARMTPADEPALERHLLWCLATLASLRGGDGAVNELEQQLGDNVRSALAREAGSETPHPANALAREFGMTLFRWGRLAESQQRLEQAAALTADDLDAAMDLAHAGAVAKCRVRGDEALRLELEVASRARAAGSDVLAALALVRAAELLYRFPGMFADPDVGAAAGYLVEAYRLAPGDGHVQAAAQVASANARPQPGEEPRQRAMDALNQARLVDDDQLESAAMDAATSELIHSGDVIAAHRLSVQRVELLTALPDSPAAGLELKDALHVATFTALGAGDLPGARLMAERQRDLPFLLEQRDLADEELLAPAALAGEWEVVRRVGARFLKDWTEAGSAPAPGRGIAPAAVALAYGLQGHDEQRVAWLRVLAAMRGVRPADASRGSGYGEVFDSLVLLDKQQPLAALETLVSPEPRGLFGFVFGQWAAALAAEAAVLACHRRADELLQAARVESLGNPVAAAITSRAAGVRARDLPLLLSLAEDFLRAGTTYQQKRTLALAEGL
jgi:predicted ATPase/DNA-binding CsgD family transcriptional regulator